MIKLKDIIEFLENFDPTSMGPNPGATEGNYDPDFYETQNAEMRKMEAVHEISFNELIMESPKMETLKKNKKPLSDEEREIVMSNGAVWHHGPNGEETPAVWKSIVKGKNWYVCNTHRAYQCKPTIRGAIQAFKFIKTTA